MSYKLKKQVTIVYLTSQDIQQYCCVLIVNENNSFCLKKMVDFQIYLNEGENFKSTLKPTPDQYYIRKSNVDVAWCGFILTREKLLQLNNSWENNPSIIKSLDEWRDFFATLNSCK